MANISPLHQRALNFAFGSDLLFPSHVKAPILPYLSHGQLSPKDIENSYQHLFYGEMKTGLAWQCHRAVSAVALRVYVFAVGTLIAPAGVVFHGTLALGQLAHLLYQRDQRILPSIEARVRAAGKDLLCTLKLVTIPVAANTVLLTVVLAPSLAASAAIFGLCLIVHMVSLHPQFLLILFLPYNLNSVFHFLHGFTFPAVLINPEVGAANLLPAKDGLALHTAAKLKKVFGICGDETGKLVQVNPQESNLEQLWTTLERMWLEAVAEQILACERESGQKFFLPIQTSLHSTSLIYSCIRTIGKSPLNLQEKREWIMRFKRLDSRRKALSSSLREVLALVAGKTFSHQIEAEIINDPIPCDWEKLFNRIRSLSPWNFAYSHMDLSLASKLQACKTDGEAILRTLTEHFPLQKPGKILPVIEPLLSSLTPARESQEPFLKAWEFALLKLPALQPERMSEEEYQTFRKSLKKLKERLPLCPEGKISCDGESISRLLLRFMGHRTIDLESRIHNESSKLRKVLIQLTRAKSSDQEDGILHWAMNHPPRLSFKDLSPLGLGNLVRVGFEASASYQLLRQLKEMEYLSAGAQWELDRLKMAICDEDVESVEAAESLAAEILFDFHPNLLPNSNRKLELQSIKVLLQRLKLLLSDASIQKVEDLKQRRRLAHGIREQYEKGLEEILWDESISIKPASSKLAQSTLQAQKEQEALIHTYSPSNSVIYYNRVGELSVSAKQREALSLELGTYELLPNQLLRYRPGLYDPALFIVDHTQLYRKVDLPPLPPGSFTQSHLNRIMSQWDLLGAGGPEHRQELQTRLGHLLNGSSGAASYARALAELLSNVNEEQAGPSKERRRYVLFTLADEFRNTCGEGVQARLRTAVWRLQNVQEFENEILIMNQDLKLEVLTSVGQELGALQRRNHEAGHTPESEGVHFLSAVKKYWGHWLGLDPAGGIEDGNADLLSSWCTSGLKASKVMSGFTSGYTAEALVAKCRDTINADTLGQALRNPGRIRDYIKEKIQDLPGFRTPASKIALKESPLAAVIEAEDYLDWDSQSLDLLYRESLDLFISGKFFHLDEYGSPLAITDAGVCFILHQMGLINHMSQAIPNLN